MTEALFENGCRVRRPARGPSFSLNRRTIEVAVRRQRLRPDGKPVRAVAESNIDSVKHVFSGGKLPVRGLARATMMVCASTVMVNLRRIHCFSQGLGIDGFFALTDIIDPLGSFSDPKSESSTIDTDECY